MSPTAHRLSTPVRHLSSVTTKPRSMRTPCSSYPSPSVDGPRPTATSSSSASRTSPPSTVTATPSSVVFTLWNGVPVRIVIFRFRNARSSALDDASSSRGTSRGSASTIVTSAPKLRHTLANSQPMTPPPSTITDAGTRSRRSACSEVRIRCPSRSSPGSVLG